MLGSVCPPVWLDGPAGSRSRSRLWKKYGSRWFGPRRKDSINLSRVVSRSAAPIRSGYTNAKTAMWATTQMTDWNLLSEPAQLRLATEAMRQATTNLAQYAEALADEMAAGVIQDWGGQDALRLFANI